MDNGGPRLRAVPDDLVVVEMWACPRCNNNSFGTRTRCYLCGEPRPIRPKIRVELWPGRLVSKGRGKGGNGGGIEGGGKGQGRAAVAPGWGPLGGAGGQKGKGGAKGVGGGGGANQDKGGQRKGLGGENGDGAGWRLRAGKTGSGKEGEREAEGGEKQSWAEVVRGKGKRGIATRPKAKAKGEVQQIRDDETSVEKDESSEEETPTQFVQPLPRCVLVSRAEELKVKVEELQKNESGSRKLRRARNLLEDTQEQIKDAGGGTENRRHFALVNCSRRIKKIEKSQEKALQEMEEIEEARHKLDERWRKVEGEAKRNTKRLEYEKSKYSYLAKNLAQEGGQLVQDYEGLRESAIRIRGALQQQGRTDLVADLDKFEVLANTFNPPKYEACRDPLLLGLEVSEESAGSIEEESSSDSGTEMDHEEERRGKKRHWREEEGAGEQARGSDQRAANDESQQKCLQKSSPQVEVEWVRLQRAQKNLLHTVEANRQIEEQERMQMLQDKEAAVIRAAAQINAERGLQAGNGLPSLGGVSAVALNSRLELQTRRRQASTPRKESRRGKRWGDISVPARENPNTMEVEDQAGRMHRKDKARAENSRSPRGRDRRSKKREESL